MKCLRVLEIGWIAHDCTLRDANEIACWDIRAVGEIEQLESLSLDRDCKTMISALLRIGRSIWAAYAHPKG